MAFELWWMALKNLSRNKRRNAATASAIVFGVAGITGSIAYYHHESNSRRVFTIYSSRMGHLQVYKPSGLEKFAFDPQRFSLTPDETSRIAKVLNSDQEVAYHGPQIHGMGLISNSCNSFPFQVLGIDPEVDQRISVHDELKTWATDAHKQFHGQHLWEASAAVNGVLLSNGLSQALEKPLLHSEVPAGYESEPIDCADPDAATKWARDSYVQMSANGWHGTPSVIDGEIIGRFNPGSISTNNSLAVVPLKVAQSLFGTDGSMRHVIWLKDARNLHGTADRIRDQLVQAGLQLDVRRFDEESVVPSYAGTLGFIDILIGFVNGLTYMIILFSVFNAATITAVERSQEIGMLRALGYTRRRIRVLFAMESAILSTVSIAVGVVAGHLLTGGLNSAGFTYRTPGMDLAHHAMTLTHNYSSMSLMSFAVLGLSLASTYLAAWTIAEKNVAHLLTGPSH
ncbi:MAG: ABC transporter permease [Deltaproteobacteria bacterium]|nr:ABC transporter permease [Deltaproteobacteria bacterium]